MTSSEPCYSPHGYHVGPRAGSAHANGVRRAFPANGRARYVARSTAVAAPPSDEDFPSFPSDDPGRAASGVSRLAPQSGTGAEQAEVYFGQRLQASRESGDRLEEGAALNNLAAVFEAKHQHELAQLCLERSLEISTDIGDKSGVCLVLNNLGHISHVRGDHETARVYLEQSLRMSREIGDHATAIPALHNLAHVAVKQGRSGHAVSSWVEALQLALGTNNHLGLFHVASALAQFLHQLGRPDQAAAVQLLASQVAPSLPGLSPGGETRA